MQNWGHSEGNTPSSAHAENFRRANSSLPSADKIKSGGAPRCGTPPDLISSADGRSEFALRKVSAAFGGSEFTAHSRRPAVRGPVSPISVMCTKKHPLNGTNPRRMARLLSRTGCFFALGTHSLRWAASREGRGHEHLFGFRAACGMICTRGARCFRGQRRGVWAGTGRLAS